MWWVGTRNDVLDIYVSTKGFAVCKAGQLEHSQDSDGVDATLASLAHWLQSAPIRARLNVFLSAGLCRPFVLVQLPPLSPEETDRALQASALKRTGLAGPCQVWLEPAKGSGTRVAAAVDQSLVDWLRALPKLVGRRQRLVSAQPLWSEWLRVALQDDPQATCVVFHDCDAVTVLSGDAGQFNIATTVATAAQDSANRDAVARLLLAADMESRPPIQGRAVLQGASRREGQKSPLSPVLEVVA